MFEIEEIEGHSFLSPSPAGRGVRGEGVAKKGKPKTSHSRRPGLLSSPLPEGEELKMIDET